MQAPTVFHALNGLRGLAAIVVLLFHAAPLFGVPIAASGYLAVDLFFMLSGFVIAHVYDARFANGLGARAFALARARRFWPLYMLGMLLGAGWIAVELVVSPPAVLTPAQLAAAFALSLLFVPFAAGGSLFPLNVPAWSLFFELVVNAAYAVVHRHLTRRVLPVAVAVLAVAVVALSIADRFDEQWLGFVRAGYGFFMGVLLYRSRALVPAAPPVPVLALLCAPLFLPARPAVEIACTLVLFPLGLSALSRERGGALVPLFERLGALSFPLYALHYPIVQAALGVAGRVPLPRVSVGGAAIAASLVAALVFERLDARHGRRRAERAAG